MLKNSKLLNETKDHFHIELPSGMKMKLAKKGLQPKAHEIIKAMPKKFAEGGVATDEDADQIKEFMNKSSESSPDEDSPATPTPSAGPAKDDQSLSQGFGNALKNPNIQDQMAYDVGKNELETGNNETPSIPSAEKISPTANQNPIDLSNPYEEQKQAVQGIANVTSQQGKEEAAATKEATEKFSALPTEEQIVAKHQKGLDDLENSYKNKQLDPDHYWKDKSTGSKIAAGIGMILGGIGSGLTGGKNVAAEMVNNAIDRDMEAQKNDQTKGMNLWKMNYEKMGNEQQANLATKNQLLTGLKFKLEMAAANAKSPLAQQNAKLAISEIDQKQKMNNALLGLHSGLNMEAGDGTEQGFVNNLNQAKMYAPDMAKDAEVKYIPSVGVARKPLTPEDISSFKEWNSLSQALNEAKNFAGNVGTTMPGTINNQKAADIQNRIQLSLNALSGLKRINEWEAKKYEKMAGNPGAFRSEAAIQSFKDLQNSIDQKKNAEMSTMGIIPFKKSSPDQMAMEWARQNPNDPRAAAVMQKAGGMR